MISIPKLLVLLAGACCAAAGCVNSTPMPTFTPDLPRPSATTISSGGHHTCALRSDGSAVCWGLNDYGQAPEVFLRTPAPKFTAITSGGAHNCGLRVDGSLGVGVPIVTVLICSDRLRGKNILVTRGIPLQKNWNHLPPHERFLAISSGLGHACALRPSGEAVCWGVNLGGRSSPFEGELLRAISSGSGHTCALRLDGSARVLGFRFGRGSIAAPG